MSKHLRNDLETLEKHLLRLAARVEEAVRKAVRALMDRRGDVAAEVIEGDIEIDRREVELEEECLKILALHQPVASDLRFVTSCLKIDNDLERVGDLATNIAERAQALCGVDRIEIPVQLTEMMELATTMLRESLNAFVQGDVDEANRVCAQDDQVDSLNRIVISEVMRRISDDPDSVEQGIALISASKNLERIADHATNIAEDVVYFVNGEIIRHRSSLASGGKNTATLPGERPSSQR